ncbi:mechanosensitive ion channel family protein [Candidatus Peregrinibacteria bacterium]|jgi:small conductance mechanosensitive channel|nr:mechanosensitive ion channel family protein [Candidatus Peregrinibacteria bacterium]MBT7736326.1 mechanosensitive ion channel family protein [Candidatus Peregrinibacteria bacterium]
MNTAYAVSATDSANQVASGTASELAKLIELVITKIPLWIAAVIVIMLSFVAAKIARKIVENKLAEKGIEEEHEELQILGGRLVYSGVVTLGFTMGLKIAGIDLTTILAAVAFGIGFALRDLIMNFLAGIMILVGRQIGIGDFINVGGTKGKVTEIQSRVTILQSFDGTKVIVPNADLFKKQVESYTSNPFRKITIAVGVDYRNKLENVIKVCMSTTKHTKGILAKPKPAVVVDSFGDNAINIKIKAWVDSKSGWVKIKSELVTNIKNSFDQYGITIPWPITTLAYDKDSTINETEFIEPEAPETAPAPVAQVAAPIPAPEAVTVDNPVAQPAEADEQPLKPLGEK